MPTTRRSTVADGTMANTEAAATAGRRARERVHPDLLTVALRGPLAGQIRRLAECHGLSLATLVKDAVLTYEAAIAGGYRPGTALAEWKAQRVGEEGAG